MFEMPGLQSTGDVKKDLDQVRRWLARFVPQLEQQLDNLGTDNFTSAYNERQEGLTSLTGAAQQKSTSAALAEHLMDNKNPHGVTLAQLGYNPLSIEEKNGSIIIHLCGMLIQIKQIEVEAGTATASGDVYKRTESAGDWEQEFAVFYTSIAAPHSSEIWTGASGADKSSAGDVTIYSAAAAQSAALIHIIGIGRG